MHESPDLYVTRRTIERESSPFALLSPREEAELARRSQSADGRKVTTLEESPLGKAPRPLSKFTHVLTSEVHPEVIALFHTLTMERVFIGSDAFGLIKRLSDPATASMSLTRDEQDIYCELDGLGFLAKTATEADALAEMRKTIPDPSLGVSYLILTTDCNFQCRYCFIGNHLNCGSTMTADRVTAALEMMFSQMPRDPRRKQKLVIYGGEPLLYPDLVCHAINECRRLQSQNGLSLDHVAISAITNGSRVTEELAEFFAAHHVKVAVSIDGPPEIQNSMRVSRGGADTFDKVDVAIKRLSAAGVLVTLSVTVSSHNVDRLPEITEWLLTRYSVPAIGFNLLIGDKGTDLTLEVLAERSADALIEAFKVARAYGAYEDTMMRKVEAFVEREPYLYNCAATGGQLVVDPQARVGTCHAFLNDRDAFPIVVDEAGSLMENESFREWSRRTPVNMAECLRCRALPICGGGCPFNAKLTTGSIWGIDAFHCTHARRTLDWLVWDLYEQMVAEEAEISNSTAQERR